MQTLRLGTRGSKLAVAQATLVKSALLRKFPQLTIEIITIETAADALSTPMAELAVDAFCLELDQALLNNEIDAAVHSRKDRDNVPPQGIVTAALAERENPRDIAIFRKDIIETLRSDKTIVLGVCSSRRKMNVPAFLAKALPQFGKEIHIETKPIRGAIDERLGKIGKDYDGIVLAVAGLNRLYKSAQGFKYMILPLSKCPTAPGQGALALDCRTDDTRTKEILSALHDKTTASHVAREFDALYQYGTDIGATSIDGKHIGNHLLFVKGPKTVFINWPQNELPPMTGPYWDGAESRAQNDTAYLSISSNRISADAVFIAHSRAVSSTLIGTLQDKILWTSGINSWYRLAQQGLWIQGCTEELGHAVLTDMITNTPFLGLPTFPEWQILTHTASKNDWNKNQIVATYQAETSFDSKTAADIAVAKHIFWSSVTQYEIYKDHVSNDCNHYCRAGKTADTLQSLHVSPLTVFPNHEMWRKCLKTA